MWRTFHLKYFKNNSYLINIIYIFYKIIPLTAVEIKEIAIVLNFDVGHLVAAAHGEREGARIRGGEAGKEGSIEALVLQQFLSFDARYRWVEPSVREGIHTFVIISSLKKFFFWVFGLSFLNIF